MSTYTNTHTHAHADLWSTEPFEIKRKPQRLRCTDGKSSSKRKMEVAKMALLLCGQRTGNGKHRRQQEAPPQKEKMVGKAIHRTHV